MSKSTYAVTIFLKSGSQLKFHTHELEYTRKGSDLTNLKWENVVDSPYNGLSHINLDQVEAITSTEIISNADLD